jgi:hypothetical protein
MAILSAIGSRRRRWSAFLLATSVLAALAQPTIPENRVEAVYLVKFIDFVNWPDSAFSAPDSPLVIGVLGEDPFGRILDEVVDGETVKNRRVIVRRFRNVREVTGVQVLFIDESETSHIHSILRALKDQNVLTVSNIEGFGYGGGIVRFVVENNKVRFRINVDAAKRANLQISSKLLELAEIIHD